MNKIYKVIWHAALRIWVAVSELARGKVKANSGRVTGVMPQLVTGPGQGGRFRKKLLACCVSLMMLGGALPVMAVDITVYNEAELAAAIANTAIDNILLGDDITISSSAPVMAFSRNITIDGGNSFGITNQKTGATTSTFEYTGTALASIKLINMTKLIANPDLKKGFVYIKENTAQATVNYDNIEDYTAPTFGSFGTGGASTNSVLNIGNITTMTLNDTTNQSLSDVNKVVFSGRFDVKAPNNALLFFNNSATQNTATMEFKADADVKIDRTGQSGAVTNTGNHAFGYTFEDGSAFELIAIQNVLAGENTNRGIRIGTYDKIANKFGAGAKIILEKNNTGGVIEGNGIDNRTTSTTGINNNATGSADVIYNLAAGSVLNVTNSGIYANKTGASNVAGIYIKNAGLINANDRGVSVSHDGTGTTLIENTGTITSQKGLYLANNSNSNASSMTVVNKGEINGSAQTIELTSTNGQVINVDNAGGNINYTGSGTGSSVSVGQYSKLDLSGGTLTTSATGNGIWFAANNTLTHTISDTIINANDNAYGIQFGNNTAIASLTNTTINVAGGTATNYIEKINFESGSGRNTINVTGTGTGISTTNTLFNTWNPAALDINVTGTGTGIDVADGGVTLDKTGLNLSATNGTALQIKDGTAGNNATTVGPDTTLNATGATAINFVGTADKTLTNNGTINGNVQFADNAAANTITNDGTLGGNLTTGSGNDTLTLNADSKSLGSINLGDGTNNVNVNGTASVQNITTGIGDDTFTLTGLEATSALLGVLNAGSGTNTLNINNSTNTLDANTTLTGFNTINLQGNTALTLVNAGNIAGGTVTFGNGTNQLNFADSYNGNFAAALSGNGATQVLNGTAVTLTQASSGYSGTWDVANGGTLTATDTNQLGTGNVELNGIINLNATAASTWNNALAGTNTGTLNIANNNTAFNFGSGVGNVYAGTVDLKNATFRLADDNTTALTAATLLADAGSVTTVGALGVPSTQAVGNLTINGGKLNFTGGAPGDNAESSIQTGTLTATSGTIDVSSDGGWSSAFSPASLTGFSLPDQDDGVTALKLIGATSVTGSVGALVLKIDGVDVTGGVISNITQNNVLVATATYNYDLANKNPAPSAEQGLYLTYHLAELNLLQDQVLSVDTTPGGNGTLSALLVGPGGIAFDANALDLTVSNAANNYTGSTTITGGTVLLGANNSFGNTSALTVNNGTTFNANNFSQTINGVLTNNGTVTLGSGSLTSNGALTNNGTLDLANGTLNITTGGTSTAINGLTGGGALNVNGGTLTLSNINDSLTAATSIASGAIVDSAANGALGSGTVTIASSGNLNLTAAQTLANTLSGAGAVNTSAAVTLNGNNSGLSGTHNISGTGVLTVGAANNLGNGSNAVMLTDSGALHLNNYSGSLGNTLTGAAGTTVQLLGSSNATLTGNNTNFSGLFDLIGTSMLNVSQASNLGSSSVAIADGSTLHFNNFAGEGASVLANTLSGAGTWQLTGSNIDLSGQINSGFTGLVDINTDSGLTINSSTQLGEAATLNVATATSTLNIIDTAAVTLNNKLTGSGQVNVNTGGNDFNLSNTVGTAFMGNVTLTNAIFDLSGINGDALVNAGLTLATGSVTHVGAATDPGTATNTETLKSLTINGGTLNFYGGAPQKQADSIISTDILTANSGTINVIGGGSWENAYPVPPGELSVLDQSRGVAAMQLVETDTPSGVNLLTLNIDGAVVNPDGGNQEYINQGGTRVAQGHYNYTLSDSTESGVKGLYMNFALTQLDLLTDDANALKITTNADVSTNHNLTTLLTGNGGISFNANAADLTVTNQDNRYTGSTRVTAGKVLLGANNSFGTTSRLTIDNGASANLAGFTQTVGTLTNSGTLDLANGTLNITNGGTSTAANGLTGAGTLNLNDGTLTLSAANSGLSAATHIAANAILDSAANGALGSSAVEVKGNLTLSVAQNLSNALSGNGQVNINDNATLSGTNSFVGTHHIAADKALTVSQAANLGGATATVNLLTNTAQLIFDGVKEAVVQTLKGNGTVTVSNAANMALAGTNNSFTGKVDIVGSSNLSVSKNDNLGTSSVAVEGGSTLTFDKLTGTLSNTLSGAGDWVLSGSNVTLNNENATGLSGVVDIKDGSTLELNSMNNRFHADASVNIDSTLDTLRITTIDASIDFNQQLQGAGILEVNSDGGTFSYGTLVGNGFTGTLRLNNTIFNLNGNNTTGNASSTLDLATGSKVTVGTGEQKIGTLNMDGGTLVFSPINESDGKLTSPGTIKADSIDTAGGGTVSVAVPPEFTPSLAGYGVLALDTGAIVVNLATTAPGQSTGSGKELALTDDTDTPMTTAYQQNISNSGSGIVAATGTFKYGLTTSSGLTGEEHDGLYVNYMLQRLELKGKDSDALVLEGLGAYNGGVANQLVAQMTGSGDVAIVAADAGAIIVIGSEDSEDNDYSGQTLVRSGTLQLGTNSALGNTSNLRISSGAAVDINGHSQTVTALNSLSGSTLDLANGALTVSEGGVAAGTLSGAGTLTLSSGTLTLSHNNNTFTGTTTIDSGATADVTQNNGLGTGAINVAGILHLDGNGGGLSAATLQNALSGSGATTLSDAANVTLSGDNHEYTGTFTTVNGTTLTAGSAQNLGGASVNNAGTLVLNTAEQWQLANDISGTGKLEKQGSGTVVIGDSDVSANLITVSAGTLLIGSAPVSDSARSAQISTLAAAASSSNVKGNVNIEKDGKFGGDGTVEGNVTNAGDLVVGKAANGGAFSDFTIKGNYVGIKDQGNVTLSTVLGDDNSATDRLVVTGDTSGESTVTINNIGGSGGRNIDGIEIIHVGGKSDGEFTLKDRVNAGILEYFLRQGTPTEANGNWYLRSDFDEKTNIFTPEAGGMVGNIATAMTLFNTRLDDLLAGRAQEEDTDADAPSGIASGELRDGNGRSSLWLRQVRARNKSEDATGQLANTSNRYVAQLGGEVFDTSLNGEDRLGLGVMAGYGRATGNSRSKVTNYRVDNKLTGYTLGVYGTWYADANARYSPYIHTLVRYDWFDASVGSADSYRVKGMSATLEGGYPFPIYQSERNQTVIIPQVQLTLNGASMNDQFNGGVLIEQKGKNNVQTRLGARLANDTRMSKTSVVTSYLDVSWIQDARQAGVESAGQRLQQAGNGHALEVRVGVDGKLNQNLSVWGTLGQQMGPHGYDDKAATLGVKYQF